MELDLSYADIIYNKLNNMNIIIDKKVYKQKIFFSAITKNLN